MDVLKRRNLNHQYFLFSIFYCWFNSNLSLKCAFGCSSETCASFFIYDSWFIFKKMRIVHWNTKYTLFTLLDYFTSFLLFTQSLVNISSKDDKWLTKRFCEQERLEIIRKLSKSNPPSKRSIAHEYNVGERAVRNLWNKKDEMK